MQKEGSQQILVYTDFTPLGDKCIEWAIFFAKKFEKDLFILHVINDNTYHIFNKEGVEDKVTNKLNEICKKIEINESVKCRSYSEEGCTCTIINSVAEAQDSFFNIIGVHGRSDPQYLSGQSAIKIIKKSRIPFFVLQRNSALPDQIKPVVLPINTKKEMKEQTGWITYFAKNLKSEIDIFFPNVTDKMLSNNLNFCSKFFDKYELKYNRVISPAKYFGFNKSALNYTAAHDRFFMMAMSNKNSSLLDWIIDPPEVKLISNKKAIPIFLINPKKDLYVPCI